MPKTEKRRSSPKRTRRSPKRSRSPKRGTSSRSRSPKRSPKPLIYLNANLGSQPADPQEITNIPFQFRKPGLAKALLKGSFLAEEKTGRDGKAYRVLTFPDPMPDIQHRKVLSGYTSGDIVFNLGPQSHSKRSLKVPMTEAEQGKHLVEVYDLQDGTGKTVGIQVVEALE